FFFSSRRRHTRCYRDWSSDVCSSDLLEDTLPLPAISQGLAGQTIGAYKLISLVGQGGMGSVWLAERSDGRFERRSALKFLNVARSEERRVGKEGRSWVARALEKKTDK